MADVITRLKLESGEYDSKIKRAVTGLQQMESECRKVGGTLAVLEKDQLDYVKSLGQMQTVANNTRGKLNELTQAYTELSVQYKRLTDEEKNGDFGKALSSSLDQLKTRINDTKSQLKDIDKELGNTKQSEDGAKSGLEGLTSALGINVKSLAGWGAALAAGKVALDVAKDAFFQSESNIDDWGRAVQASEAAYNVFLQTLNTGNWSDFFQNLNTAINGARDLYDALDRLGSIKSNNQAAIAIVQQQIAQLRLAKQQGQNVDAQLKKATETLANLQKQSVDAGKNAGRMMAAETIKNRFNAQGGNLAGSSANAIVERIMKNGQAEFDRQKKILDDLTKKGTGTRDYGTYKVQNVFDINNLTKEQQKQYKLAKAITEGETEIQKGIATYAQAVQEGTSNAREEFKGNRYALQGTTGKNKKVTIVAGPDLDKLFPEYGSTGGSLSRGERLMQSIQGDLAYSKMAADQEALKNIMTLAMKEGLNTSDIDANDLLERIFNGEDIPTDFWDGLMERLNEALSEMGKSGYDLDESGKLIERKTPEERATRRQDATIVKQLDKFNGDFSKMTGGVSSIVSGIQSMGVEIPKEIQNVIGVLSGVSSILSGITTLLALIQIDTKTTAAASVTDAIIPFAGGGIVGRAASGMLVGTHMSGDNLRMPVMGGSGGFIGVNDGEIILNKAQQGNLVSQLEGGGIGNLHLDTIISGEDIRVVLKNNGRRTGRGEYITSRNSRS